MLSVISRAYQQRNKVMANEPPSRHNIARITAESLQSALMLLERLETKVDNQIAVLDEVRMSVGLVKNDVQQIENMLGVDRESTLPMRVGFLEREVSKLADQIKRIESGSEKSGTRRWEIWVALIGSFLGLISSLVVWLITR